MIKNKPGQARSVNIRGEKVAVGRISKNYPLSPTSKIIVSSSALAKLNNLRKKLFKKIN